ncbi:MAG: hypothetical protein N2652_09275 [Kiritimatiellae bacterium]|nr:hypothetical protein [Kiritimatiellia bacterium]
MRIARYLGINRSLDSSIEEPKRYELPAGGVRAWEGWWGRWGLRREPTGRPAARAVRFHDPLVRSGGVRILF